MCNCDNSWLSIVFSGVGGVLITGIVSTIVLVVQLRATRKSTNFSNLIKLKELFSEGHHWNVYRYFLGEIVDEPSSSDIFDYLGLFEIAYEMYLQKEISEYEFYNTYFYRIYSFSTHGKVKKMIENEAALWEKLYELILNNLDWGYKNHRISKHQLKQVKNDYKNVEYKLNRIK